MNKIRYAVVGLGNITQDAFLPAFKNARNVELAALVSGDPEKRLELAKQYHLDPEATYSYEDYDKCLANGNLDAVYIGLPNHLHCKYTVAAAKAGIHVLCEKPMAVDETECKTMMAACHDAGVKLMIAYRLHFEQGNLEAIEVASSGKLGDLRMFQSTFSQQVPEDNVRLTEPETLGGGSVYDLGVYCINAARNLFRAEPIEVVAMSASDGEIRFRANQEMAAVTLRFPEERLATFLTSFNGPSISSFTLTGTEGWLRMEPAFDFHKGLAYEVNIGKEAVKRKEFPKRDQFGAELEYFSDCILTGRDPEPSGREGLADIRVVRAILKSAETRRPVKLGPYKKKQRPSKRQAIRKPAVKPPRMVNAQLPTGD